LSSSILSNFNGGDVPNASSAVCVARHDKSERRACSLWAYRALDAAGLLLRIIARAYDMQTRLMQNTDLSLHAIASQEHVTAGYVSRLLRLPSLAPDIITAIINGKNPPQLTAKKLMRLSLQIPINWTEQRKLLGFRLG
jgi:MarR-like DNA-binding transcriptional regulator SgrR of sgrS sRNA